MVFFSQPQLILQSLLHGNDFSIDLNEKMAWNDSYNHIV